MKKTKFWKAKIVLSALFVIVSAGNLYAKNDVFYAPDEVGESNSSSSLVNVRAEFDIFELVNQERSRKNLRELEWNDELANLARSYSRKMARENFFDHYDNDGATVIDRANSARIRNWTKIGENLFFCQSIGDYTGLAVSGWLKSASHRRNMLDREWTDTGIGAAKGRDGRIYVTQIFIKR